MPPEYARRVLGIDGLTWGVLAFVIIAALFAGWVDAVVGGGGLVQLPAMLLIPGITPVQALATNKLGSIFGTTTSSITYYRRAKPDMRTATIMAVIALIGSFVGAFVATILPASVFKPIIVLALIGVAMFTAFKPAMGAQAALRFHGKKHILTATALGAVIGFYDGMIGPGTGTFLVISLVGLIGYDFLQASAKAKIVNFATNFGALLLFVPHGSVLWMLGIVVGFANMLGSYIGSRMAISKGTKFIRIVFLVVVAALIVKLSIDVWAENIAPMLTS